MDNKPPLSYVPSKPIDIPNKNNLSYSMIIDNEKKIDNSPKDIDKISPSEYFRIEPRKLLSWTDDKNSIQCYHCTNLFTFFKRKHHCRICGRIFCYDCCNIFKVIPYNKILQENANDNKIFADKNYNNVKQRICISCNSKLENEKINHIYYEICLYLDIKDNKQLCITNKKWAKSSLLYLSNVRELSYVLPYYKFSNYECKLLWINRIYFSGHSKWIYQLIKSIDWDNIENLNYYEEEIINLLHLKSNTNCWNLMCSRDCNEKLQIEELIILVSLNLPLKLKKIIVYNISKISEKECYIYLPFLIYELESKHHSNLVKKLLFNLTKNNYNLKNILFCQLIFYIHNNSNKIILPIFNNLLQDIILFSDNTIKYKLFKTYEFIKKIKNDSTSYNFSIIDSLFEFKNKKINNISLLPFHLPFNSKYVCFNFDISNITIKNSINKPKVIPFHCYYNNYDIKNKNNNTLSLSLDTISLSENSSSNSSDYFDKNQKSNISSNIFNDHEIFEEYSDDNEDSNTEYIKEVLFKQQDLRKDYIIMNLIKVVDFILKKYENINAHVIKYNILPITNNYGIIEIVPNSCTLYSIENDKKFSIQNYILEKNKNDDLHKIRSRFVKSCAVFCVINYIFGIGDRHLENIMITTKGIIFHIDFDYILGEDPKPFQPEIRLTKEMILVMGGEKSIYYNNFKEICIKIYNCLRRHVNLFYHLLLYFSKSNPNIDSKYTEEFIKNQVIKRFNPGENYKESTFQFNITIEENYSNNTSSLVCKY